MQHQLHHHIDEGESKYKYYLFSIAPEIQITNKSTTKTIINDNTYKNKVTAKMSYNHSREIEHTSLTACDIQTNNTIQVQQNATSHQWAATTANNNNTKTEPTPITNLPPGTTIRLSPMEYNFGGWTDDIHFHPQFKLPQSSTISKGIIITLQAKAKECIAVALSPQPGFILGKTYVVHIGAMNNLQTVIRRRLPNTNDAVDVCIPSPKVCSDAVYRHYWIVLQGNGQLSVGLGKNPGVDCIGTLDDSMYHALRSGVDAVRYIGLGNSALGRKARDLKVRDVKIMSIPTCFRDSIVPMTPYDPSRSSGSSNFDDKDLNENNNIASGGGGYDDEENTLWIEYQKECEKAKKRAIKFNIEYKQPPPDAFFKWSEARRMRSNHERGFITGMDIMSTEEKMKAGKRKERFEAEEKRNRELGLIGNNDHNNQEDGNYGNKNDDDLEGKDDSMIQDGDDDNEDKNVQDYNVANDINTRQKREPLPIEQAWDNIDLVEQFRVDPPPKDGIIGESTNNDASNMMKDDLDTTGATTNITLVPEKLHLFAIDWAAFKQIRTDDIMGYFSMYGPSYVEWLGELSCNVLFGDKYSAARAMEGMSRLLPDEVPQSLFQKKNENIDDDYNNSKDDNAMGIDDNDTGTGCSDRGVEEDKNMAGTFTIDRSMDESKNRNESATNKMEGNGNDASANSNDSEMAEDSITQGNANTINASKVTNLGKLGWRFCNYPIWKRQDDRYGRRGTRARILIRVANSLDVLEERPTSWPKPPPGFSTKHVLGPGSDFRRYSRKRNRRYGENDSKRRRRTI